MRLGRGLCAELFDETGGGIANLRTFALPVSQALGRVAERFLACRPFGILKTEALDQAAISRALRICDHQIKKRTLFGAASCQPDNNHGNCDPENAERA
jgi:hypothetical protein